MNDLLYGIRPHSAAVPARTRQRKHATKLTRPAAQFQPLLSTAEPMKPIAEYEWLKPGLGMSPSSTYHDQTSSSMLANDEGRPPELNRV